MKTPRDKYLNDEQFRNLVDILVSYIHQAHYTPSEIRQAAILASIIYEEIRIKEYTLTSDHNIDGALRAIHEWVDIEEEIYKEKGKDGSQRSKGENGEEDNSH